MSGTRRCPKCGGDLKSTGSGPGWMNREQWEASKAGDYFCETCRDPGTKSGATYYFESDLASLVGVGDACYYVLDVRSVVGNCAMWWCPDSQGYTCEIDKAGLYTEAECRSMRDTDIPIHRDVVQQFVIRHVRLDHLRQAGHLDAFEKAKADREQEAKRSRRRRKRSADA